MITYKDMTFCTAGGTRCGNTECPRYLQDADYEKAASLGLPFSFSSFWNRCSIRIPIEESADEQRML